MADYVGGRGEGRSAAEKQIRKVGMLMFMIVGSIGQSIAGLGPGVNVVGVIIFWRVIMGLGVGGGYPLSSVITSEFSSKKWRGAMMNAVFAMYSP